MRHKNFEIRSPYCESIENLFSNNDTRVIKIGGYNFSIKYIDKH